MPPGGLGDHLQGHMGYLQIRWDSQMQNVLLLGTWHPHPHHQGHKGVGHVHLGALGNHLQGYMGRVFFRHLDPNSGPIFV